MKASTTRAMAIAALALAAGLAGGVLQSSAAAQETQDPGYGYHYPPPPATAPPDTYPPATYPPMTSPPVSSPPVTSPPVTSPPGTPLVSTPPPPPETTPPDTPELPETGVRGLTLAGGGLVLIGIGILAWVFAGRRRIRT